MKIIFALLLAAPLVATAAGKNELIVVPAMTKSSAVVSLDFASSGDAAGVSFIIDVGVTSDKQVDLSGCAKGLPAGRSGACGFKDGKVMGVVYSPDGTAIPAGIISVGRIAVKGAVAAPKVVTVEAFDVAGNPIQSSVASNEK